MAVRLFDGTDDLLTIGPGALTTPLNGAYSLVFIMNPTSLGATEVGFGIFRSGGFLNLTLFTSGGGLRFVNDVDDCSSGDAGITAGEWHILGISKAAGTVAPRFHKKQLGSGSWTHVAAGASATDRSQAVSSITIGGGNGEFYDAMFASVALYSSELSDANFESIQTTPSTAQLSSLGAVALWDLNQASTATAVEDLVGSADQTALVGTTVVSGDDPPGWTFGLGGTNATVTMTNIRATGSAAIVAPPRPRPAHPYTELNVRM